MSVQLYFGLPGAGKTTILAKLAHDADVKIERDKKRILKGKKPLCPYQHIYSNIPLENIKNFTVIKYDWLGKYDIHDCLILIDEASLEVDNRNYKSFKEHSKMFMLLLRHFNADCIYFNQDWGALDKKIRTITDRVYYIYKDPILGNWFSRYYRVPYGIIIPDPKKTDSEKLGEIVQGYCKPSIFIRLFTLPIFRPKYYKYFDSWDRPVLPALPENI